VSVKPDPDINPGAIVVCVPASTPAKFADDVIAPCANRCGTLVRHRPLIPAHAQKWCTACVGKMVAAAQASGDPVTAIVTPAVQRELALYYSCGRRQ
jgi:hypothetical protein